jgi:23S rRNA pseudouridine1911/1915/1917 synthase
MKMKLVVDKELIRRDKYISDNTLYSRELITKMLKDGYILVNKKITKPSYKTKINDIIDIDESYVKKQDIEPQNIPIDVVYEDNDIMVINKRSGLVVHPGNGNTDNTLVNGLMYYTNDLSDISGEDRIGIVHRLDKDTSGLMLVAKNNKAHEILSDDFKNHKVYKEYYALLIGRFPSDTALIDAPIGRDKNNFNKMCIRSDGKSARTHLKVIKRYKDYTLVSLVLETGRTHQIRVHMAYTGYPIYNDPVYQNKPTTEFGKFLHSKKIRFVHPITKKEMEFECDLPIEFKSFIDNLD